MDITEKREKEKQTVQFMIALYCHKKHSTKKGELCEEREKLYAYACKRIEHCQHMETKTFCSKCKTHCYAPEMKEKIRDVMKFSGPRMLLYNPVLAMKHMISQ